MTWNTMRNTIFLLTFAFVFANPAREAYQRTSEILKIVERIEEQLNKENRLREITDIVRIDTTMDRMNKKLDRILTLLEDSDSSPMQGRNSLATPISRADRNIGENLQGIDERLGRLEESVGRMNGVLSHADLQKLNEIDQRSASLKDDLDKKLRKMMNIITALYEMNKDIKTNLGGRSEVLDDTPRTPQPNFAAEFLVENLEELERKIKEQFSVLTNEIRSEITGLKIVASGISDGCDRGASSEFDDDDPSPGSSRGQRRSSRRDGRNRGRDSDSSLVDNTLDNLVQTLGRTTREIKEEIHNGMQAIDQKLSNLTNSQSLRCEGEDPLDASASVLQPVRVSRGYELPAEQALDDRSNGKKEVCTKIAKNVASPNSCAELRKGGANCDGIYIIFLQNVRAVRVLCDMTTEGGGWTVLMRRGDFGDQMTSFHRNWLSYKNGFGDMEGEFWLGNDALNLLTTQDDNILRVRLESFDGEDTNLTYSSFRVADEADSYRLHLGPAIGPSTPASNSLKYHNNHPFSTFDKKNDEFAQNCAASYKGGWWFNGCYFGFLTGEYFRPGEKRENWQGILWYDWKGNASLKGGLMMIRPNNFTIY